MDGFSLKASLGAELPGSDGEVDGLGLGAKVSDGGIHIGFFEVYTKTPLTYSISKFATHFITRTNWAILFSSIGTYVFLEVVPGPRHDSGVFVHAYLPFPLLETQQYCGQLLLSWSSIQPLL